MNNNDKRFFWIANIVFYITATFFLFSEGVFELLDFFGYIIILIAYLSCSVFLYIYVKGRRPH